MTLLYAILLGIVQGATEFLPVSSSGHLILAQTILGIRQPSLFFEVLLHIGTLFAVICFYRREVTEVIRDIFAAAKIAFAGGSLQQTLSLEGLRIAIFVVVASIPTALIGLGLNKYVDPENADSFVTPGLVAITLIFNGIMLYGYRWLPKSGAINSSYRETSGNVVDAAENSHPRRHLQLWGLSLAAAFVIGVVQGAAIMPGISRSGATITAALLLGAQREGAAKFSFLLSIPAILGAFLLKFRELDLGAISLNQWLIFFVGAITAAAVGLFCLKALVFLLRNTQFYLFAYYCWAVGIAAIAYIYL